MDLVKTDRHGAESFRIRLSWHLGVELIDVVQKQFDILNFGDLNVTLSLS
jgi:hypothetical protein